jgi:RNA polymerase sigma-70 factor (ECF subfamily)
LDQINNFLDPQASPEEKLVLDELRADVNKCLDLLPPEYRRLLHLKYYQQLSNRDISLRLHLSPRKVEGRLYRARHRLASVIAAASPHLKP